VSDGHAWELVVSCSIHVPVYLTLRALLQVKIEQESCAIAKMTAQCALYMVP